MSDERMKPGESDIDELVDDESQWGDVVGRGKGRERKETVVSVRLPSEVARIARQYADACGMTLSAWAREVLSRQVEPITIRGLTRSYSQTSVIFGGSSSVTLADAAKLLTPRAS
jgi:hypothetical protein